MIADEFFHEPDARRILQYLEADAARFEELLLAEEGLVLTDDDARDAVEENRAAAHRARRKRRVQDRVAIHGRRMSSRILEGVHLPVQDGAPLLHTAIVTSAEHPAAVHDHRSDRDAALPPSLLGLLDRRPHECVRHSSMIVENSTNS